MTRAPKPLPEHGTYARYVGRPRSGSDTGRAGCGCELCRAAMRAYGRRRNLMAATGRQLTIDAAPTTAHLRRLRAAGAGWNELVAVTGCSSSSISAYLNGTRTVVRRTTACRILNVRLAQVICPNRSVSALGSVRRLRALVAAGHQIQEISQACGIDQTTVSYLVNQHIETVRAATHQAIDAAFERLSMVPGTDARSIIRGRQNGWPPPLAWDNPDDPDEQPTFGTVASRPEAIVEDVAELASQRLPREVIAARLGASWSYIGSIHSRLGKPLPQVSA